MLKGTADEINIGEVTGEKRTVAPGRQLHCRWHNIYGRAGMSIPVAVRIEIKNVGSTVVTLSEIGDQISVIYRSGTHMWNK